MVLGVVVVMVVVFFGIFGAWRELQQWWREREGFFLFFSSKWPLFIEEVRVGEDSV